MVAGKPRAPYPRGLTKRLPAAHPDLNAVRETLHNFPHDAGNVRPGLETLIPAAAHEPARGALRLLVLLAAIAAALVTVAPAAAASSCGRAVIDDWYDDGRVDGTYALHCYDDAIEILPRDVRDYSSAKEDIQRALQAAKRGEDAPPARTDPTPTGGSGDPDEPTDPTGTTDTLPSTDPDDGDDEGETAAGGATDNDSGSASSVPIPLLILAGLALLLIARGHRRLRDPPAAGPPAAAAALELAPRPPSGG